MPDQGGSRQNVTFPSHGRRAHGYLALPPQGVGPGLVLIHDRWGLTGQITATADRFAAEGFIVLVPDLYAGPTAHDGAEADLLLHEPPREEAARDLRAAVEFLLVDRAVVGDAVGVAGFCLGGGLALELAAEEGDRVAAVVPFYGLPREPGYDYGGLTAHVLGHFGELDRSHPAAEVDEAAIRIGEATDRRPEIHFYPAGHAFMNEENVTGTYDAMQSRIAWRRTLSFLWGHLG